MNSAAVLDLAPRLVLEEKKAAELMTSNPVSVRENATVREAIQLLTHREISGAPVIDEAGRPVGVVSRGDILVHDREAVDFVGPADEDESDVTRVRDIMTPAVFCVSPDAPASQVVREMTDLKVHRLFVVDDLGTLIGVISVLDVLRPPDRSVSPCLSEEAMIADLTTPSLEVRPAAAPPPRLLIVDDDEALRETLARRFARSGMAVTTAESGEEALAKIGRAAFDVALLDLHLPGMSGIDLLARLKEQQPELEVLC